MKIINFSLESTPKNNEDIALCLGYFDGVHLGHKFLISEAKKSGLKVAVLTFDNSPAFVLNKKSSFELTKLCDKALIFEDLGVEILYVMHFDEGTLNISKDEFVQKVLNLLSPRKIYCGEDYKFGKNGEGNPSYLSQYFDVTVINALKNDLVKISSRNIRELISFGKIEKANELLGHPYTISGKVMEGNKIGQKNGFPTANVVNENYIFPKDGVYAGYAYVDNKKYKAMVSIGTHPTIKEANKSIIEAHLLDFSDDLYGKDLKIEFLHYIRDIIKFNNLEELTIQLVNDKKIIKNTLQ